MLLLIPAAFSSSYWVLVGIFAYATFAYAACSTIFLAMPGDVFDSRAVASVSGMSGTGAGALTILTTLLIGWTADRFSFQPIIIVASLIPCIATVLLVGLVRTQKNPDPKGILLEF